MSEFQALITGAVAGALMKGADTGPFLIDVDVPVDEEGNYRREVHVTGQQTGEQLRIVVEKVESDDLTSAMRDMSRAIRKQLERFGPNLRSIPLPTLKEQTQIVGAFYLDMKAQIEERDDEV